MVEGENSSKIMSLTLSTPLLSYPPYPNHHLNFTSY